MKAIGKFLKRLILFLFSCFLFVLVACSSIRQWTPTYVPEVIQDLSGDAYHTWGGFTTLGIVDMDNKIIEGKIYRFKNKHRRINSFDRIDCRQCTKNSRRRFCWWFAIFVFIRKENDRERSDFNSRTQTNY